MKIFVQATEPIFQWMQNKYSIWKDSRVVISGGYTRIPLLRNTILQQFPTNEIEFVEHRPYLKCPSIDGNLLTNM